MVPRLNSVEITSETHVTADGVQLGPVLRTELLLARFCVHALSERDARASRSGRHVVSCPWRKKHCTMDLREQHQVFSDKVTEVERLLE